MLDDLLKDVDYHVAHEVAQPVEIVERDTFPTAFFLEARRWQRMEDCVVVAADLSNSTKLGFDRRANTSARVYEAATGGAIRIAAHRMFSPEFIDIQGDGFFAIFHGERRYQRALACAVTVVTSSVRSLVPRFKVKFGDEIPETGFRAGIASGTLLVKRVGVRGDKNEPVWAGKPVNWAFKAAQSVGPHQTVVTNSVWERLRSNDYIRYSCGCEDGVPTGTTSDLWVAHRIEKLPPEHADGKMCPSSWCEKHGQDFCSAILDGKSKRPGVGRLDVF